MISAERFQFARHNEIAGRVRGQRQQISQVNGVLGVGRVGRRDGGAGLFAGGNGRVRVGDGYRAGFRRHRWIHVEEFGFERGVIQSEPGRKTMRIS